MRFRRVRMKGNRAGISIELYIEKGWPPGMSANIDRYPIFVSGNSDPAPMA